jgi:hypothetical protein
MKQTYFKIIKGYSWGDKLFLITPDSRILHILGSRNPNYQYSITDEDWEGEI